MKTTIKIVLAILLLVCLLPMPYGYFQLIRFLGMTTFAWLAYIDNSKKDKTFFIIWVASALLINPIMKIALGRIIWNIVDVAWAVLLFATILIDKKQTSDQNRS